MAYFNPSRPSYLDDPYPALARLREQAPVHFSPDIPGWVVTRYDLCFRILHEPETFDSDFFPWEYAGRDEERAGREEIFASVPRLTNSTASDHLRRRGPVAPAFAHATIEEVRPQLVEVAERYVDAIVPGESFDLIAAVAQPVPDALLPGRMGIDASEYETLVSWARAMLIASEPFASAEKMAEGRESRDRLAAYLETFDDRPADDGRAGDGAVTLALRARAAGGLTLEEVAAVIVDVSLGDSLTAMIGNAVLALAEHPDQLALLRDDPTLIAGAVEELVRYDPSSHTLMRVVTAETTLGVQPLKPGDMLFLMIGAANRDPAQFDDPDRLDVTRAPQAHLGFSAGAHFCIGAPFSRLTIEAVVSALVGRFKRLEAVEGGLVRTNSFLTRTLERLELVAR